MFSPSYKCEEIIENGEIPEGVSPTIAGWRKQSEIIQNYLEVLIDNSLQEGTTLIVEGVHLDPLFIEKMATKYGR